MNTDVWKKFFVLEGLDGSGTTTQLKAIAAALETEGFSLFTTFEPTSRPIGELIRKVLRHEVEVSPLALAKLFTADREDHLYGAGGIKENLNSGKIVLCDRYFFSSLAYQSLGVPFKQVLDLNSVFPLPEKLYFLDVPIETAVKRRDDRDGEELFEKKSLQNKILNNYWEGINHYSDKGLALEVIDGQKEIQEITKVVLDDILKSR